MNNDLPSVGILRILASICYDWLLLIALLILATALVVIPLVLLGIEVDVIRHNLLFRCYLFLVPILFFCGFWIYGGQTLGMRAWRIRVVHCNGKPLDIKTALLRFFGSILSLLPFGLGFLWCLADQKGLTWHDHISSTYLQRV
ncbi:hypothetical protein TI03_02240 [Achromatium sp. WMS1]|nr:hypothetical protein TI03_02240 [Achromatium sp. WMS1]